MTIRFPFSQGVLGALKPVINEEGYERWKRFKVGKLTPHLFGAHTDQKFLQTEHGQASRRKGGGFHRGEGLRTRLPAGDSAEGGEAAKRKVQGPCRNAKEG